MSPRGRAVCTRFALKGRQREKNPSLCLHFSFDLSFLVRLPRCIHPAGFFPLLGLARPRASAIFSHFYWRRCRRRENNGGCSPSPRSIRRQKLYKVYASNLFAMFGPRNFFSFFFFHNATAVETTAHEITKESHEFHGEKLLSLLHRALARVGGGISLSLSPHACMHSV